MKADREVEVLFFLSLTSTVEGGEWSASPYAALSTGEGRRLLRNVPCTLTDRSFDSKCGTQGVLMRAALNFRVSNLDFLAC